MKQVSRQHYCILNICNHIFVVFLNFMYISSNTFLNFSKQKKFGNNNIFFNLLHDETLSSLFCKAKLQPIILFQHLGVEQCLDLVYFFIFNLIFLVERELWHYEAV